MDTRSMFLHAFIYLTAALAAILLVGIVIGPWGLGLPHQETYAKISLMILAGRTPVRRLSRPWNL
jgi:hypothetical protein